MKENGYYSKVDKIFETNGSFITRKQIDEANIPSWFFYDYIKKNNLRKAYPGCYANEEYDADEYFILQTRYPKYIFSGLSALYVLGLSERMPDYIEVAAPYGYHPNRKKIDNLIIKSYSNPSIYNLGISRAETMYSNPVYCYDAERCICDLVKYRDEYDSESFIKSMRFYLEEVNDQGKLFEYARKLGVFSEVFKVMELLVNED